VECTIDGSYFGDSEYETVFSGLTVATKKHECVECRKIIQIGDSYDCYKGKDLDTEHLYTIRTCVDCDSIHKAFWASGVCLAGQLLDDVREHIIYELHGDVDSSCIIPLTQEAKTQVFTMIEEAWDYFEDEE
jgi:hypothetical protein